MGFMSNTSTPSSLPRSSNRSRPVACSSLRGVSDVGSERRPRASQAWHDWKPDSRLCSRRTRLEPRLLLEPLLDSNPHRTPRGVDHILVRLYPSPFRLKWDYCSASLCAPHPFARLPLRSSPPPRQPHRTALTPTPAPTHSVGTVPGLAPGPRSWGGPCPAERIAEREKARTWSWALGACRTKRARGRDRSERRTVAMM
jgi:hypothetical protein